MLVWKVAGVAAAASVLNGPYKCSGPPLARAKVGTVVVNPASAKKTTKRPTVASAVNGDEDRRFAREL